MAKIARPTYDVGWYTPSEIMAKLSSKASLQREVRKEYTRLRDISQKRLKRLAAAGYENADVYKKNVKHYPKLKDIKTDTELAQRLSDLSRFVGSTQSTVRGLKEREKKVLKTLKKNGYKYIDESNLSDFGEFMEYYRDAMYDLEYDSGDAADLYTVVEKNKLDPEKVKEDFDFWLENIEDAKKIRKAKRRTGKTSEVLEELVAKVYQED